MNIKINNIAYKIKPMSKLSVAEFMLIVDKMRYVDLVSYISALVGFEIDKAKVEIQDIELGERMLLDSDIDFSKIETPLLYKDSIVKDLDDGTFGKRYMFNLRRKQYELEQIGIIELCVYALAICLSKEEDYSDIDDVYLSLLKLEWITILPIGFFLSKQLSNKRNYLMRFLLKSISRLQFTTKQIRLESKGIHMI